MELKRLSPYSKKWHFPEPWKLDTEWFDRLEIREVNRRHYKHLQEAELFMIEAQRRLIHSYVAEGILREGKTLDGLVKRMAQDLDATWLTPGKGRAVDFSGALVVLENFTRYVNWASEFSSGESSILDVVLPYQNKVGLDSTVGFLRVQVTLKGLSIGKLGDLHWEDGVIQLTEIELNPDWRPGFDKMPLEHVHPELWKRVFSWHHGARRSVHGFLNWISESYRINSLGQHDLASMFTLSPTDRPTLSNQELVIWAKNLTAPQVQTFLDKLAMYYFMARIPKGSWNIQFDVRNDLTAIHVACAFGERGPFGYFYSQPEQLLDPTHPELFVPLELRQHRRPT